MGEREPVRLRPTLPSLSLSLPILKQTKILETDHLLPQRCVVRTSTAVSLSNPKSELSYFLILCFETISSTDSTVRSGKIVAKFAMSVRWCTLNSRVSVTFLVCWICLSCFPGFILSAVVTLDSITIFTTHELLAAPSVYFKCKDENKTELPDVTKANVLYTFKGEESWQPLTELASKKCKRCGFYEADTIKSDDVYDEWEFCPSDFTSPDGKYTCSKDGEFNATFSCPQCLSIGGGGVVAPKHDASVSDDDGKKMHIAIVVTIVIVSILVVTLLIAGIVKGIKYWQKRKRQQEQARFLKLFEDGDEIEDELGLGTII